VIVIVVVGVILYMFRAKKHPAEEVPTQIHGNSKLEIAWTILPGVILLPIAVFTIATVFDLAQKPDNALVVDVIGQQWWWEFDYPDQGIITANEIVIPTGRDVQVRISSVMSSTRSGYTLNGKRDAVPGACRASRSKRTRRASTGGSAPSTAACRTPACASEPWRSRPTTSARVASSRSLRPLPPGGSPGQARDLHRCGCNSCAITGVSDPKDVRSSQVPLPTSPPHEPHHVRGWSYPLITGSGHRSAGPTGTPVECLNRQDLEAWLPGETLVPMAADQPACPTSISPRLRSTASWPTCPPSRSGASHGDHR
jgi:hypothetical protein